MVDFGLVALVLLNLGICCASFIAWFSMRSELRFMGQISDRIDQAQKASEQALDLIQKMETEHYKGLAKRFDRHVDDLEKCRKENADLAESLKSVSMRVAAMKRWNKADKETPSDDAAKNELPETLPGFFENQNQQNLMPGYQRPEGFGKRKVA